MSAMETAFAAACQAQEIKGAILTAQDATGKFQYAKAFGKRTKIDGSEKDLEIDDVLFLASSSKLLTTVAALQCVEKGLLTLTEDVSRFVPELGKVQVLTGMGEDGKPILEDKVRPITLKSLLTHSSGFKYDMMDPLLLQWRESRGENPSTGQTVKERLHFPLSFQPGSEWAYGVSIDWAGKLVECVTGETLENYMRTHIWEPVGAKDTTFWPMANEQLKTRMVDYNPKDPKGAGLPASNGYDVHAGATDCFGGQGLYSTALDYLKIMHSLLINDGRLLRKETADTMFQPQLEGEAKQSFHGIMSTPATNAWFGQGTPVEMERDFGFGGLLIDQDNPGWYGKGTITWTGGINSAWFIDRANGICGFGAPQLNLPPDVVGAGELTRLYRKGIYDAYNSWKANQ